jgi:hypothetical protein
LERGDRCGAARLGESKFKGARLKAAATNSTPTVAREWWGEVQRVRCAIRIIAAMAITHSTIRSQRGMCSQPLPQLPFE